MTAAAELNIVTGAFSFTGKYITRRLLAGDKQVKTLTGHPLRQNPFEGKVEAVGFHFDRPATLTANLKGASTLYNTYWIRFEHAQATFERTLEQTRILLRCAAKAGVGHIVHFSSIHADARSALPYFRAKGLAEQLVEESGIPCTILRPTLMFGLESSFCNNLAWMLRKFPMFAVAGSGRYSIQPVFVDDVAELAVRAGRNRQLLNTDVAGPEVFTFDALVKLLARKIGCRARLMHVSPRRALKMVALINDMVNDVVLTADEIRGMMENLIVSDAPPLGHTLFSDWLDKNAEALGIKYYSELKYHFC